ncbi:class III lanthipeptide [Bacillus methanolicus]
MSTVLQLQKMDPSTSLQSNSNISITCKKHSTLSLFVCVLPPEQS